MEISTAPSLPTAMAASVPSLQTGVERLALFTTGIASVYVVLLTVVSAAGYLACIFAHDPITNDAWINACPGFIMNARIGHFTDPNHYWTNRSSKDPPLPGESTAYTEYKLWAWQYFGLELVPAGLFAFVYVGVWAIIIGIGLAIAGYILGLIITAAAYLCILPDLLWWSRVPSAPISELPIAVETDEDGGGGGGGEKTIEV